MPPKPQTLQLSPGPIALILLLATAVLILLGIWTGDGRWAVSGLVTLVAGAGTGIAWLLR